MTTINILTISHSHTYHEISSLLLTAAWGYHRQGYCQAGFSAAATKVVVIIIIIVIIVIIIIKIIPVIVIVTI